MIIVPNRTEEKKMEEEQKSRPEVIDREFVSGFALSGEFVKNLPDKSFVIVGQRTELVPAIDDPSQKNEKLILTVELKDHTIIDYLPNKTSQKTIIAKRGYKLANWIGFAGEFITFSQKIGQNMKDVIYIKGENA